jgi:DNA polymerase alpha subunit B
LDPPSTTSRPTLTSLVLETSRRLGGGARVPLNLSAVPSVSLFPGQIIGVRGVNASGSYLAVQEILLPPRLPCPDVAASDVLTRGIRIIMASGPWGTDTGGWEGFEEICRIAQAESVDVLILVRPTLTHAHKRRPVVIADGPLSR